MKILLVRPKPAPETIGLQHVMLVEPLELEVLAACVPVTDEVVIVDMILERAAFATILARERPDVLGVTGYITNVPAMVAYCAAAKRLDPRIVTIVGGVHCEVCPDDLDHPAIDYRIVRNATTTFGPLLARLRGTGAVPPGVYAAGEPVTPASLPPFDFTFPRPNRSLTQRYRHRYFYIFHDRVALVKTAFGCPHRCDFCFCKAITAGRFAQRPLGEVMEELAEIAEEEIYIVDDDFLADRGRVEAFIAEVARRGIHKRYLIYGRADFIAAHPDVLAAFRRVGLRTVIVGIESFFDEELAGFGKQTTAATNRAALAVLAELGVDCFATMIVSPAWDRARFADCGRILKTLGVRYVNLQPLTPLPGTGLAPVESVLLARDDFPRWDLAHVSLAPEHLSVADFYRELVALYDDLLFQPGVLWGYLRTYGLRQCWRLACGSARVRRQYLAKIREAEKDVSCPRSC
jgi:radical SAM superfamily enzyme YgiQ (UPF0313 family)